MNYTNDTEQIVFIKDGDIVASLDGKTLSGNAVELNGIPSFDLLSTLHHQLSTYDDNLSTYIRDVVGLSAENLSTEISTVVAVVDEDGNKYNHLSVYNLTNAAYKELSANDKLEKNAVYVIKDTFVSMREQQVKDVAEPTLSTDAATKNYVDVNDESIIDYADSISVKVDSLSGKVDNLIDRDKKDVTYLGDVVLSSQYIDPEGAAIVNNTLYGLLLTNDKNEGGPNRERALHVGFMFKVVSDDHFKEYMLLDGLDGSILLKDNDYIIVNKEVDAVKNVSVDDITIIKDYDLSVKLLQDQILSNDIDISYLSGNIDWLSSDLSAAKDSLSNDIETLFATIKGGVNYKGHIDLNAETTEDPPQPVYPANLPLSAIFARYYHILDVDGVYLENRELSNGYLYNVTTAKEYVTSDGISFENNDYIIIHNHDGNSVDVSALTQANIDIIEAVQDDYVRLYQHTQLSIQLSSEIDVLSAKLSIETNSLSNRLSSEIDSLSARLSTDIDSLSTRLSNEIDSLSARLSTGIDSLSNRLSTDIDSLSTRLSSEIDTLSSHLSGDVDSLSNRLSTEIDVLSTELKSFAHDTFIHISGDVGIGELQLSNDLSTVNGATFGSDSTATKVQLKNNGVLKYTINNNNVYKEEFDIKFQTKSGVVALASDVEDLSTSLSSTAHKEVEDLSTSLSSSVNGQFVHLSGDVINGSLDIKNKLSVESHVTFGSDDNKYVFSFDTYEGKIYTCEKEHDNTPLSEIANSEYHSHKFQNVDGMIAHVKDVEDLSTSLSTTVDDQFILSAEAVDLIRETLFEEIDALSNDISANRNAIVSNDNDINYLSAQLSTVADGHYYRTLSSIQAAGHTDAFPDNLLVTDHTDESNHKDYFMLFKYGTLVLSSIN